MVIDKNYFLTRLANGESIDDIGMEIAGLMNAAMADHEAKVAAEKAAAEEARKEANLLNTKRELALDLVEIIQDYGAIVAPEACVDLLSDITDEDLDAMIQTLDEMFKMMAAMVELKDALTPVLEAQPKSKITPVSKKPKSDDEVLANFIKNLL